MFFLLITRTDGRVSYRECQSKDEAERRREEYLTRPKVKDVTVCEQLRIYI